MTKTMPQSAANDNHGDFESLWEEAHRAFRELVRAVAGPDADFASRERAGLDVGNELCRADQEQELRLRGSVRGKAGEEDLSEVRRGEEGE